MGKRILSLLLVVVMLLGSMPLQAFATGTEAANEADAGLGQVRVIVENNTCPLDESTSGCWQSGATPWTGTLIDMWVPLKADSTAVSCVADALNADTAKQHTITGADTGYISEIDGLIAPADVYSCGWMGTLNDWFTNMALGEYSVASGTLSSGDEIRLMYTMKMGADIGSNFSDSTKTLKALSVSGGTLTPDFSANRKNYELELGEGNTSGTVTVTPTANNKNFQVRVYKGSTYSSADAGFKRSASIPVNAGDTILVVVGDPAWPSMNDGASVPAEVYTISVVEKAAAPTVTVESFFTALDGVATVTNSEAYPFQVTEDGTALVSSNAGQSNSASALTLTFTKAAKLSFRFKMSSEKGWDFLKISKNGTALNDSYGDKSNFSDLMTDYKEYSIQLDANDVLELAYSKDSGGDKGSDCAWLKDFTVALPYAVTFHANDGTETTAQQGIFGTASLTANTFTREGYRFDGWAASADGAVVYADQAEITLAGNTDLYAVWTKVWGVTFPNMPEGASVTVKQGDTVLPPQAEGSWILPDGSYTYSASLFGYESAENIPFTVSGGDLAVQGSLTASAKAAVSFTVTPAEAAASVEVRNSEDAVMTAEEGVYSLPTGTYSYTVKAKGYKKVTGEFTVKSADAKTIPVTLEVSHVWEGDISEAAPAQVDGIYQIGTGAELAWFARQVNEGQTGIKGVLTSDIQLNAPDETFINKWQPIGTKTSPFTGSFHGAGHTVTGVFITEGSTIGLFGSVASGGSVENLTLSKATVSGTEYVGAAVGQNAGTVSGVMVVGSNVTGKQSIGGVVGKNTGTVTACVNSDGTVTQDVKADQGIGGVVGENAGTVSLSWNGSRLIRGHSSTNYAYFGGIAGKNSGTVTDCYNLGEVDLAYHSGGIVGNTASGNKIINCYNAGTVKKEGKYAISYGTTGTFTNCYYLDSCGATSDKATAKTAEELKLLATELGGSFENRGDGYPILKWQNPNATFTITLTVSPADSTVVLTQGSTVVTAASAENGVYTFAGLSAGSYTYTISNEPGDYEPQSGTIVIGKADVSKTVELAVRRYDVTFTLTPADTTLTVSNSADEVQTGESSGNGVTYALPNGTYTYTAEKFGYVTSSGTFTVDKAAADIAVTLTQAENHALTFQVTPSNAVITVSHQGEVQEADESGIYHLSDSTYDYTVRLKGYVTVRGQVTMAGADQTIPITMTETQPWAGDVAEDFSGGAGTQTDPYQIASGEELAYLSALVAGGEYADKYFALTDDIDMGGTVSFMPIGTSSSYAFTGHFDGGGYVISNLLVDNGEDSYAGLFGYVKAGCEIRNVVLKNASITTTGDYAGSLIGRGYGSYSGKITVDGCAVLDSTISGTGSVGGLVGYGYYTVLSNSYAAGVQVTGTDVKAGGLMGYIGGSSEINSCFVRGTVSGASSVGGIVGEYSSYSSAKLMSSYADVAVTATGSDYGPVSGKSAISAGYVSNSFYNADAQCNGSGSATTTPSGMAKTAAELKSNAILTSLGDAYAIMGQEERFVNNGFPYLKNVYHVIITPALLGVPTDLSWNGATAQWTAVENASAYALTLYKDGEEKATETVTGGSIDLSERIAFLGSGAYTFRVKAVGDGISYRDSALSAESEAYSAIVSGANVTFRVTAAPGSAFGAGDPVITVITASGKELTAANGTALYLPSGDYTYRITAKTFATLEGTISVSSADQTVEKTMEFSPVWDGVTTVEPALADGVYQITNGYELAWFRDAVNATVAGGHSSDLSAILVNNIDLGNHPWTVIGPFSQNSYGGINTSADIGYTGTFDGNEKTISGLKIDTDAQGSGLFGYIYGDACITDLTVSGTISCGQYAGGIVVAMGGGRVENCVSNVHITANVNKQNIMAGGIVGFISYKAETGAVVNCVNNGTINCDGNGYVGGIVGSVNKGAEISNCVNNAAITGTSSVAGIVGNNAGCPIKGCVNTGNITGTKSVGGIAGFSNKTLTDCYNTGSISGTSTASEGVGGIAGRLNGKYGGAVDGSYNTGVITDSAGIACGAIVGSKGDVSEAEVKNTVTRSFYLENTCAQGIGSNAVETDEAEAKTEAELKSLMLTASLGGQFASRNDGSFPVLKWQDANASFVTAFVLTPADAEVAVKQGEQTVAAVQPGIYLLGGEEYTYSVSKAKYNTASGTISASSESRLISVELEKETFAVTFNITPADATVTIRDSENQVVSPTADGFRLPNGSYTYCVEKFGCQPANGSFTVEDAPVQIPQITLVSSQLYAVTMTPVFQGGTAPGAYTISVSCGDQVVAELTESSPSAQLPDGSYTYRLVAPGFFDAEGSFTVSGEAQTVSFDVQLRTTWDGSTATEPHQVDGVYQITCAEELAWLAQQVNGGQTDLNAILLADIYINDELSSNTWTSIGGYSHQYTGTFDGNGKAVRGLNAPLFGYGGHGSLVRNVTVYGTISGSSNVGGVCTASYGSFEGCTNYAAITATGQRVGGVVGIVYDTGSVTNCANYGTVSSSYSGSEYADSGTACVGGVVGDADGPVTGCANFASVTAGSLNYGGVGGVVGVAADTLTNSYNTGAVQGCKRTGGVVGITSGTVSNVYNIGAVTATSTNANPFSGAVVGDAKGTVTNTYYLTGTAAKGVGYGSGEATAKTGEEMKQDAFVTALGGGFNADGETAVNGGYPVLPWQGGRAPSAGQDAEDVAADKLALTVSPTVIREATTLVLPNQGENGSAITWSSSDESVISDTGAVVLPASGKTEVTLTASITKGTASDTKTVTVTVYSLAETAAEELAALKTELEKTSVLRPVYAVDTNIVDFVKAKAAAALPEGNVVVTQSALNVALTGKGTNSTPNDTTQHFADDGTITYFFRDLTQSGMNVGIVRDVTFTLSCAGVSETYTVQVNLPWNAAKVREAMQAIQTGLTFDVIKGNNTAADRITSELTLPVNLEGYGWATITWESDQDALFIQEGNIPALDHATGYVFPEDTDIPVKLTATISFNLTQDGEAEITETKVIPVTVPSAANTVVHEMEAVLEKYTLDKIKDLTTDGDVDFNAVANDLQLLTPKDLGIDGKIYSLTVAASSGAVQVNAYRANVLRPLPGAEPAQVTLTARITHKDTGTYREKVLGTVTVLPLQQAEIDAELALMELVKASYFEGIRNENTDTDAITGDLHAFQEVYQKDGGLVWVYSYNDRTQKGIIPTDIPKDGYDESYNLFQSSDPTIIKHENLLLQAIPANNTKITITSCLTSQEFARYAQLYPDNADLQKLANQMVSVTVTVRGNSADQQKANAVYDQIKAIGTVTEESRPAIEAARAAYDALTEEQKKLVDNYDVLEAAEEAVKPVRTLQGSGTEADPWLIQSLEDYRLVSEMVSQGHSFAGEYLKQTANITLTADWTPIGVKGKPFSGDLNGGNNLITVAENGKCLIGYPVKAKISNLNIYGKQIAGYGLVESYSSGATVDIDHVTIKEGTQTLKSGLIGGYASGRDVVNITNCVVEAGVVIGYDKQQSNIGSIAGEFNGTMSNCESAATVYGVSFVGGILGNKGQSMGTCSVTECSFTGTVAATGNYVGGISGSGYGGTQWGLASAPNTPGITIKNCTVSGTITGGDYVGGILGAEAGMVQAWSNGVGYIQDNTFTGTVSAAAGAKLGGIVGYMHSLNRYTVISGNYYKDGCGAQRGIGGCTYIDTSCTTHETQIGVTYFNTETGDNYIAPPEVGSGWNKVNWRADHNRTDDPLGADAGKLCYTEERTEKYIQTLTLSGSYKTEYPVGDAFDTTGMVFTATWSDGTTTTPDIKEIQFTGFTSEKEGEVSVTAQYGDASCIFTVTVKPKSTKITVTISLLGDSKHGSGSVHGLAMGGLTTWIDGASCKADTAETVWQVLKRLLDEKGYSYSNPSGNYMQSINGLAEFDNGPNSGWMYTLNGAYPKNGVNQQYLKDGDVIVFHYTDDYTKENSGIGDDDGNKDAEAAENAEKLIDAIGTVTLDSADKIEAARTAYDQLTAAQKKLVGNFDTLTAAETKYAQLKAADDKAKADAVEALIDKIDAKITLDSEEEIVDARKAYDALTADQKKLVDNYKKLTNAEYQLALLKADEADRKKAKEVIDRIDKLDPVILSSEEAIQAARAAYDKLTNTQKALVTNRAKLEAAEEKLAKLKDQAAYEDAYKTTGDYLEKLGTPQVGSVGGEWMVIGLARSGRNVPDGYYENVTAYVRENIDENQRLHKTKSTDNSRLILALTAMGKDVSDVEGHNLLAGLNDMDYIQKQGINGPIWALIAFDSGNYPTPEGNVTREALLQAILDAQLDDGGWALSGKDADPDMTGMALQALAPYCKSNQNVKSAADKAVTALSRIQNADGGYSGIDGSSSESIDQVIVALTALGIDPDTDERFIKNGISALDALLTYYVNGGGFKHVTDGQLDGMATEQGYYALAAYARFLDSKTSLYNMTDVINKGGDPADVPTGTEPAQTEPTQTEPAPTQPAETGEEGSGFPWWIIIVIVVAGAAVAVIVVVSKRKAGK